MSASADSLKASLLPRVLAGEGIKIVAAEFGLTIEEIEAFVETSGTLEGKLWAKGRRLADVRAAMARIRREGQERSVNKRRRYDAEYRQLREEEKDLAAEIAQLSRTRIPMHQAVPRG